MSFEEYLTTRGGTPGGGVKYSHAPSFSALLVLFVVNNSLLREEDTKACACLERLAPLAHASLRGALLGEQGQPPLHQLHKATA